MPKKSHSYNARGAIAERGHCCGHRVSRSTFGDITYTKPGTYIYDINEIIPSNVTLSVSAYDSTTYRVTVTVTDDHKGRLTAAASMQNLSDNSTAERATFTNTFAAKDETLVLEAIKQFVDKDGNALTQTSE